MAATQERSTADLLRRLSEQTTTGFALGWVIAGHRAG